MRRADRLCVASLTLYFVRQRPELRQKLGSALNLGCAYFFSNIFENIESPAHFRIREYSREYHCLQRSFAADPGGSADYASMHLDEARSRVLVEVSLASRKQANARAAIHEPDGDRECASARSDAPRDVDGGGATPAGENENENENAILKIRMRLAVRLGFFHSYFSTSAASSDIQVRDRATTDAIA